MNGLFRSLAVVFFRDWNFRLIILDIKEDEHVHCSTLPLNNNGTLNHGRFQGSNR